MRLTLTITDDQETATFEILPSPFTKSRDIGKAEVTTQSGDIYTDFVYKKLNFKYKWGFLTEAEYRQLEGFYDRQFTLNKYPHITIPSLGIENMVVRMQLSEQNIVNNCGMVEDVTVSFRETTQQSYTPQPVPPVIGDLVYMQDFATLTESEMASVINSMVEEQVYTLKDSRDQQDYPIIKAKNGMVIMTKNLRIVGKTITPEDSDIEEGTFDIPNNQPIDFKTTADDKTANHAYLDEEHGGLYTWACATAGSGDLLSESGAVAPHSIAPKGWKIMTGAEMQSLLIAYEIRNNEDGSTKLRGTPLNFEFGQYAAMTNGTIYSGHDEGLYWYSDITSATQANSLDITSSLVYSKPNNRPYGFSVRCILRSGGGMIKPIIEQLTYMQDVTICDFDILAASMELEKVYTLIDKRDNTPYKIALLKDGNIWMVENLRIADCLCTPEDSDITDGSFQIPASSLLTDMKNITATTDNVYIHQPFNTGYYSVKTITAATYAGESATAIGSIMPRGWSLASPEDFDGLVKAYPTEEERLKTPVPGMTMYGDAENGVLANHAYGYYWTNYGSHYFRVQSGHANSSRSTCAFMARGIVRKKEPEE